MHILPGHTYKSTNAKSRSAKACACADVTDLSTTDLLALCDVFGNHVKAGVAHKISRANTRSVVLNSLNSHYRQLCACTCVYVFVRACVCVGDCVCSCGLTCMYPCVRV